MASPRYPLKVDGTAVESPGDRIAQLARELVQAEAETLAAQSSSPSATISSRSWCSVD